MQYFKVMTLIEKSKIEFERKEFLRRKEKSKEINSLKERLKKQRELKNRKRARLSSSFIYLNSSLSDNEENLNENNKNDYFKKTEIFDLYKNSNNQIFEKECQFQKTKTIFVYKKVVYFDKKGVYCYF